MGRRPVFIYYELKGQDSNEIEVNCRALSRAWPIVEFTQKLTVLIVN